MYSRTDLGNAFDHARVALHDVRTRRESNSTCG